MFYPSKLGARVGSHSRFDRSTFSGLCVPGMHASGTLSFTSDACVLMEIETVALAPVSNPFTTSTQVRTRTESIVELYRQ